MNIRLTIAITLALPFAPHLLAAETVEEKSADGKIKIRYAVDDQKRKNGLFEEFFANGKHKIKAIYKAGELEGNFTEYHENGNIHVSSTYKNGKQNGAYTEYTEKGAKLLTATYKDGKLNGALTQFEKGKAAFTHSFKDGEPVYGRTLEQIRKKLAEIDPEPKKVNSDTPDLDAALRRLKAYRYICGVPYDNLALDNEMNRCTEAASKICEKIGRLDHTPTNPGMPDAEYKVAYKGTSHSNLAMGYRTLRQAVDGWMDDSDEGNIDRLGHRRWCINPPMQKTGFGMAGRYSAMWSFDASQKNVPDYEFVAYPTKGYMPVEYFGAKHAWSVSFQSGKYTVNESSAKAAIYEVDEHLSRGEAVKLKYQHIDTGGYGIPNCVIFQPEAIDLSAGKRYLVEITGVANLPLRYLVEFVDLKQ